MTIQYSSDQLQRKFSGPPGTPGFPRLGEVLRTEGRLEEAIQICQDGLKVRPFQLSGYLVLGKAFLDAGRLEDAKIQFETALRVDSRCLSAMRYLADILNKSHSSDAASGYYRSILAVEPWDAEIRTLLGEALQSAPSVDSPSLRTAPAFSDSGMQDFVPGFHTDGDTFQKPEGLVGDVLEVNFSEVADFLPEQADDIMLAPRNEDLSLKAGSSESSKIQKEPIVFPEALTKEPESLPVAPEGMAAATTRLDREDQDLAPISGQDVEDRLDTLFGMDDLNPAKPPLPVEAWTPPELPKRDLAPSEDFSARNDSFTGAAATDFMQAEATQQFIEPEWQPEIVADKFNTNLDQVSGEDIEKRLDDLFSLNENDLSGGGSPTETSAFIPSEIARTETDGAISTDPGTTESPLSELIDANDIGETLHIDSQALATQDLETPTWSPSEAQSPLNPSGSLMSTESMLPVGWLADSGEQPGITGSDIEAQLDRLFDLEGNSDAMDSTAFPKEASPDLVQDPQATSFESREILNDPPEEDPDQTITMPAMRESGGKEAIPDWLMRQPEAEMPMEPEFPGTLAPEDSEGLADTVTIEMVDGNDVAERLDELFADEASATDTIVMARLPDDTMKVVPDILETSDSEARVTGDEVASRLSDIFETEVEKPLEPALEDEEGYLEEEMPLQTEGGANVATVTLAEIYFQQGLKEQALQIYRQLLEREPENESVHKRISEIEASKADGENRGSESDPRRTRPGLKVPKRKK
jgi:tetratricopeptide (TPR) repeat protein